MSLFKRIADLVWRRTGSKDHTPSAPIAVRVSVDDGVVIIRPVMPVQIEPTADPHTPRSKRDRISR